MSSADLKLAIAALDAAGLNPQMASARLSHQAIANADTLPATDRRGYSARRLRVADVLAACGDRVHALDLLTVAQREALAEQYLQQNEDKRYRDLIAEGMDDADARYHAEQSAIHEDSHRETMRADLEEMLAGHGLGWFHRALYERYPTLRER